MAGVEFESFGFFAIFSGIVGFGRRENLIEGLAGGGIPFPPVQGATVLHRLARLYKVAVQGATQGATFSKFLCKLRPVSFQMFH